MFTMAFTSPVFTSIKMATPISPFTSFSSSTRARSAKSCIPTSMVVTMSAPSTGESTGISRYLLSTLRRCIRPLVPRRIESYDSSRPYLALSLAPNISPTVRWAKEPNGRRRELYSSQWKPPLYFGSERKGRRFTSQKVL